MTLFKGFFARQALLVMLQLVVFALLLIQIASTYLQTVHQQKAESVRQLLAHHTNNDPKLLARQIQNTFDLWSLNIDRLDGSKVYSNIDPAKNNSPYSELFFLAVKVLPLSDTISSDELDLRLAFEVNLQQELVLIEQLFILFMLVVFTFSLLSYWFLRQKMSHFLATSSTSIAQAIAGYAAKQNPNEAFDFSKIPSEFNEVIKAIKLVGSSPDEPIADRQVIYNAKPDSAKDTLTGLPVREQFVEYFERHLHQQKSPNSGCLVMVRCSELQEINQTRGYQEGDNYVKEVVEIITKASNTYYNRQVYRLNGSDFAVVLPSQSLKETERFCEQLQTKFNEYQHLFETDAIAYIGIVQYAPSKSLSELLTMVDTAIAIAQTKQTNAWHTQQFSDVDSQEFATLGTKNWRQVIDDVIENSRINLICQTIEPCKSGTHSYGEILTRFKTSQGQVLPTASLLAMADKLERIVEIDRLIITKALQLISEKEPKEQLFGLNLMASNIHSEQFVQWLEQQLQQHPQLSQKLIFEVSESGLQQNLKASKHFIEMLHQYGARITVERFGVGLTSFKFFRDLQPDFIKMDGSYTRNIDSDQNNQYFVRLMIDLAHRIGVGVYAAGVETAAEKQTLQDLEVDGLQGYHIGKPTQF